MIKANDNDNDNCQKDDDNDATCTQGKWSDAHQIQLQRDCHLVQVDHHCGDHHIILLIIIMVIIILSY